MALPNGYYLQPSSAGKIALVNRRGRLVLPGPIAAYRVSGVIVAGALGEVSQAARTCSNDCPFEAQPDTRYFILNTSSGEVMTGLDELEWRAGLRRFEVPSTFRIVTPVLALR